MSFKLKEKYRVKNHDGVFIAVGKSFLLGKPAVKMKKKYRKEFITVRETDLESLNNISLDKII